MAETTPLQPAVKEYCPCGAEFMMSSALFGDTVEEKKLMFEQIALFRKNHKHFIPAQGDVHTKTEVKPQPSFIGFTKE